MNLLESRLRYKFRNPLLMAEALTHPSLGHETRERHFTNQRLEFLGDAVLQLIFTEALYKLFPTFSEGNLTKLRSSLVSRDGLKKLARKIGLGECLMMGRGEENNGGRDRSSILADAFEALMGAMYLDSNFETVQKFVLQEAASDLAKLSEKPTELNPKGTLQETLQAISPRSPSYFVISETGPEHLKQFVTIVQWDGKELGRGSGGSKKQAEIAAALDALSCQRWLDIAESNANYSNVPAEL